MTLEVIRNALPAISDQMSADFQRASYNMMIYEVRDYCCALVGPGGELVSQNVGGVSHFVADLGVVIIDGVRRYGADGFEPGDVLITNHQAVAGQHLNNVVVYAPVFFDDRLVCFSVVRAHWTDIGGHSTTLAGIADPWMEGLQMDQLKVHRAGVPNDSLLSIIRSNVRLPKASLGDLRSQIAACELGARRVQELYARYGADVVETAVAQIFAASEQLCRNAVAEIPDGTYEASAIVDDDDGPSTEPVPIHARVIVSGSDMTIDLSGCSQQRSGPANSRTLAAARVAYKCLTTPHKPVNEGSFRGLDVVIPEGNIMMATFPAPMAAWSKVVPTVIDTILTALAPVLEQRVPAAHLGYLGGLLLFVGEDPEDHEPFIVQSIEGGGWGGRPHEDGASASVSVCQGDVRNAPIETLELCAPLVVEGRRLRTDSGGAGRWRGGLGLEVTVRNLVPGMWRAFRDGRRRCPPWGLRGGHDGAPAAFLLSPTGADELVSVMGFSHHVAAGSRICIRTAGGGGWGHPHDREPERVLDDVKAGVVSRAAARSQYGVVIGDGLSIDEAATARLRRSEVCRGAGTTAATWQHA